MSNLRDIFEEKGLPAISDCVVYFPQDELSVMVSEFVEAKINFNYEAMSFSDEIELSEGAQVKDYAERCTDDCGTIEDIIATSTSTRELE